MWVGRRLRRFEDPSLLRGEGTFVADIATTCGFIRFVRSPFARGRIIDIETPEAADGAVVLTAADLDGVGTIKPLLHRNDFIPIEQPILARDEVVYAGQPIAAVIADTQQDAEDLAEEIFVDIDPMEPVVDLDRAMEEDAPQVHGHVPRNTVIDAHLETPGFDSVFEGAPHHVDIEIRSRRESAMPIEARGAHAAFDAREKRVTLTSATQAPHVIRTAIADVLRMREVELRVVAPDVGGAFGQKYSLAVEDVLTVWAARNLRRDVAWIEDRRENFTSSFHSRDQRYIVTGAFEPDGKMIAMRADIRCNVGAFSCYPVTCGVEPLMAMAELPGPYDLRNYSVRARAVVSNACPIAPYRGVSRPVITLTLERLMDKAAGEIGLDPVEIRRKNLIREFPYTSVTGLVYDEASYVESLERAVELVDLDGFRTRQRSAREEGRYLGIGFSSFSERTGYGTSAFAARQMDITLGYETVELNMDPSGFVEARIGASPHGQGLKTSLSQLIADEIGIDPSDITVVYGDTDRTPYGWGTFASRSMVIAGGAAKLGSEELRRRLSKIASDELEVAEEDLEFGGGTATVKGTSLSAPISDLARTAYHRSHRLQAGAEPGLRIKATYNPHGTFSNACHVAMAEVDAETGAVHLQNFLVVEDAGVLINPMIADGQVHGGVAQGIASALYEELVYDSEGTLLTTSLMDYLPPTMTEIPRIEIEHIVTRSDATITGAKGLGEGGTIGAPAAILNAVTDALSPFGVQVNEMPATPERIRKLIRTAQGGS